MNKNILIVGSTGFIGKSMLEYYSKKYDSCSVKGISSQNVDMLSSEAPKLLSNYYNENSILIWCSFIKRQGHDDVNSYNNNMMMSSHLVSALQIKMPHKIICISSAAVYGEDVQHEDAIDELTPPCPVSYYGLAKLHCEQLLEHAMRDGLKKQLLILRPTTIFGQNGMPNYDPMGFWHEILNREKVEIWGEGEEMRDFVHIDDFVKMVECMMNEGFFGRVNVVSGKSISFREILNFISAHSDKKFKIVKKDRSKNKVDCYYDNRKLKKLTFNFSCSLVEEILKVEINKSKVWN